MDENNKDLFADRTLPWEGLGKSVKMALDSRTALKIAGLDWEVAPVVGMMPHQNT